MTDEPATQYSNHESREGNESEMPDSDAELLKAIAEARGAKLTAWAYDSRHGHEQGFYYTLEGEPFSPVTNITDARPLLVELLREGWELRYCAPDDEYIMQPRAGEPKYDPSLERCISLAWLEMWRAKQ